MADNSMKVVIPDNIELSYYKKGDRYFIRYTATYYNIDNISFDIIAKATKEAFEGIKEGNDTVEVVVNNDIFPDKYYEISVIVSTYNLGNYLHDIATEMYIQAYAHMNKEDIENNARNRLALLFHEIDGIEYDLTQKFIMLK